MPLLGHQVAWRSWRRHRAEEERHLEFIISKDVRSLIGSAAVEAVKQARYDALIVIPCIFLLVFFTRLSKAATFNTRHLLQQAKGSTLRAAEEP